MEVQQVCSSVLIVLKYKLFGCCLFWQVMRRRPLVRSKGSAPRLIWQHHPAPLLLLPTPAASTLADLAAVPRGNHHQGRLPQRLLLQRVQKTTKNEAPRQSNTTSPSYNTGTYPSRGCSHTKRQWSSGSASSETTPPESPGNQKWDTKQVWQLHPAPFSFHNLWYQL